MKKSLVVAFLMIGSLMFAQKVKVTKGDLSFLKDQKEVNVVFDFSNLKLMKENLTEAQYIENRKNELNEKSRGNGDAWEKKWEGAREMFWKPKFLELVNVVLQKKKQDTFFKEEAQGTKYTLIVDVVWIYPGWDVAMMKQPAKVTTNLRFVETDNQSNVLCELESENAPGDQWGNNFSNESRIGEGFAKTGKTLAGFILKAVK